MPVSIKTMMAKAMMRDEAGARTKLAMTLAAARHGEHVGRARQRNDSQPQQREFLHWMPRLGSCHVSTFASRTSSSSQRN